MSVPFAQNLQLHLIGDAGVVLNSGKVETWQDQSGNGNDCTQTAAVNRPTPVVDAAGRQGIAFSNSDTEMSSMNMPIGVSVNLGNASVFAAVSYFGKKTIPNAYVGFGPNADQGQLGYWSPTSTDGFIYTTNSSGGGIASSIREHWGLAAIGYSADATSVRFYDQTNTDSIAALSGVAAGGFVGAGFASQTSCRGTLYELLVFNRALTDPESLQVIEYLKTRYGVLDISHNIVFEGDSITEGNGSTHNRNYPFYTNLPGFRVKNAATFGHDWADIISQGSQLDTDHKPVGLTNVIVAFCGTNDLIGLGRTPAQAAADAQTWAASRKAAGWDHVGMITMLPRGTATDEDDRQNYNALLRDAAGNSWDFVIEVEDDPIIGRYGANTDTTYYADTVHMTSEGYKRIALIIQRTLLEFLYPNTNSGIVTHKATTGRGVYFTIEDLNGNLWDSSSFIQQNMSGWLGHITVMGEEVAGSGKYRGLFPIDIPAGTYKITVHSRTLTDAPAPTDTVESSWFVQWTGTKLFSEGLPQQVDGMTDASFKEAMLAYIGGKSSVVDNGDGTRTITYKKQDGITSKLVITFNANGEFTETQVA